VSSREALYSESKAVIVSKPQFSAYLNTNEICQAVSNAQPANKESQATQLVRLARLQVKELFHDSENCFATIQKNGHWETHSLRSQSMRRWLTWLYFQQEHKSANNEVVRSALETLAGFALHTGPEKRTAIRMAGDCANLYLDLANEHWQVVEISYSGWRVIESRNCPVRFRRAHGMMALPEPEKDGSINDLRHFINISSEDDWLLLVGWLLAAYRDRGPYPVLAIHGEHGSAKSTAARVLRELVDPNLAGLRSEPKEPRDLMIAANNGWIVNLDNLSRLPGWLSDALCRLATGGGFGTRQLYEDDREAIFEAQRPVILNGIPEVATNGDLLDRTIVLHLPVIDETARKLEEKFWREFQTARPRILGALLTVVSSALANLAKTRLARLPRMADFALWVTAAESALGWTSGSFMNAYGANRDSAIDLALEASPVAALVQKLTLPWTGTATELLTDLEALADEKTLRLKTWPRDGSSLSRKLRRLAPALRAIHIDMQIDRNPTRKRGRFVRISQC
jgi:hypothetical protein